MILCLIHKLINTHAASRRAVTENTAPSLRVQLRAHLTRDPSLFKPGWTDRRPGEEGIKTERNMASKATECLTLSEDQIKVLEENFNKVTKHPDGTTLMLIAAECGLSEEYTEVRVNLMFKRLSLYSAIMYTYSILCI